MSGSLGRPHRSRACGPGAGARRESCTSSLAGRWCGRSRSYSKVSTCTHPASCTEFCTFSAPCTLCRTKQALRIFLLSSHAAGQCHGMYVPAAGRHAHSLSPCMRARGPQWCRILARWRRSGSSMLSTLHQPSGTGFRSSARHSFGRFVLQRTTGPRPRPMPGWRCVRPSNAACDPPALSSCNLLTPRDPPYGPSQARRL